MAACKLFERVLWLIALTLAFRHASGAGSYGGALRNAAHEVRALALGGALGLRDIGANVQLRFAQRRAGADSGEAGWRRARPSRVALVTGANAGVGLALAELLAERGVSVILGCRSLERGTAAVSRVRACARGGARVELVQLDLCSHASVRAFCAAVRRRWGSLDLIVANAGIMATPWARTAEGLEEQWAANFAGHFLLLRLLWSRLSADGRVLLLSSVAHYGGYRPGEFERLADDCAPRAPAGAAQPARAAAASPAGTAASAPASSPYSAYKRSKWALACAAPELQRRLARGAQAVCAVHPGLVDTELAFGFFRQYLPPALLRPLQRALLRTPAEAARSVLDALALPPAEAAGAYVVDGRVQPADWVVRRSPEVGARLWALASRQVGLTVSQQADSRLTEQGAGS